MNLLLLGSNYFEKSLAALGHRAAHVDCAGADPRLDAVLPTLGFTPDAIVLTDDLGRRSLPGGWSDFSGTKAWYCVDSPINGFWQKPLAALFDLVLVDQKSPAASLAALFPERVHWLPVAVDTSLYQGPEEARVHDVGFVGVVNDRVRPKRSRHSDPPLPALGRPYGRRPGGGLGFAGPGGPALPPLPAGAQRKPLSRRDHAHVRGPGLGRAALDRGPGRRGPGHLLPRR